MRPGIFLRVSWHISPGSAGEKGVELKIGKGSSSFSFFLLCQAACGISVPSPNHWTAREFLRWLLICECFPGGLMVKNLPASAGVRDKGSIPGSGRSPGEGNGNPLQYSCLKNPMDRRAWGATVQRVAKSQTLLKQCSMHAYMPSMGTFN